MSLPARRTRGRHRSTGRRALTLLALAGLLATLMPAASTLAAKGSGAGAAAATISKNDRALLAEARANGKSEITLLVQAKAGQIASAASAITALGGKVGYREDAIDYLRVTVAIAKVDAVANLASVKSLDVNEVLPLPDPSPEGVVAVLPQPAPGAGTPNDNPYMPINDIGAADWLADNPTWDGRGTTIGIVDLGITLDHPSLLTTSTGERKIVDWVTATDPFIDGDPTWLDMTAQVNATPTFTFSTVSYTAPAAGSYRIALFNERNPNLGGEVGSDVNRDGNPAGSSGIFAVLWNATTNQVWVDTNQNQTFADDLAMTDYKVNFDINWFGTDNPATAVAERMPFVVQTDGKRKVVNIGIVSGFHGSHVAGIAAGNSLFGGAMSGAAPGAKLISIRACLFIAGCTATALIEGMIYAAKQSNVDVINMSIGGLPALNDGNNTRAALYNSLIETYNVQIFLSAGNSGPGMNTIGDPAVATKAMAVGAYITDATYLADYGVDFNAADGEDNLHYFSSRGPREDGGLKPQIVASGAAISTTPLWQAGSPVPGTYALPPGYQLANGTSMAAPQAAGGAALLLSAANATGAQAQPAQIREAYNSSARFLDKYEAYEQGNGLINVNDAWDLLATNLKTVDITSRVPVNTVLSSFLAEPGFGVGINDREGVEAGDSYSRQYTFRRTSGAGGTTTYALSWVGNDGTFSSAGSIALPKNVNVTLNVTVNPTTSGVHSAILNLDDTSTPGIEYQTLNTVVAAEQFTAGNDYTVVKSGTLDPGQFHTYFYQVPAGTPALKVDMVGGGAAGAGAIRFLRWHPYGLGIDSNAVSNCYNGAPGGCATGSPTSRTTTAPLAGVWEVTVDARRNSDALAAPYTLTVSILGATVSPNPDTIAAATIGVPIARSYTLTNLFGAFTGRGVGTALGSAFIATPSIANHAVQDFDVTVAAGSTSLRATIGGTSDPAADLDLFVFNCTTGTCVQAGSNADGDSEESVTIANPAAGLWRVRVDGFSVPAGTTTYNYIDVFANPAFGSVSITDANALRPAGSSWIVPGSVTANAAPAAGRVLFGNVQVRTDTNVLVGSGDVIVQSVTP